MIEYTIEIDLGANFVKDEDVQRAQQAINSALVREGLETTEQLRAARDEYDKRIESQDCDDELADKYEHVVSAGDLALTEGWHNPDGASLSVRVN